VDLKSGRESPVHAEAQLAATGTAPIQVSLDPISANAATDDLLAAMLRANPRVSDLIFSPGRKLQVQVNDEFVTVERPGLSFLTADDTRRIASDLLGNNKAAIGMLREQGYCDVSYALPGLARFRVNVFIQRGSCAVVMRVIPTAVPDFKSLGAPEQLREVAAVRDGLVLIAGPRGSGKSSTLAALLDYINENETCTSLLSRTRLSSCTTISVPRSISENCIVTPRVFRTPCGRRCGKFRM